MSRPESSPAYLTRCIEEILDALCEAHELARSGHLDNRFAEAVRFANDLLEIVNDGVIDDRAVATALEEARENVKFVSALMPSSRTVH